MRFRNPRVSILLPVRNVAATLPACLRSIARQTESRWECIVVDDGSTDETAGVAARASRLDPRVRVAAIAPAGLVAALNEGLRRCRAPYVARMDGDDLMHRERLSAQLDALDADATLAGVGCHVRLFPRRPMSAGLLAYEAWLNGMRSAADVAREASDAARVASACATSAHGAANSFAWPSSPPWIVRRHADGQLLVESGDRMLVAGRTSPVTGHPSASVSRTPNRKPGTEPETRTKNRGGRTSCNHHSVNQGRGEGTPNPA